MTVPALDDRHDLLIRGGYESTEGTRDRYAYDRQDMLWDSLEAWRVNPLARRIVALTSQYVVGAGIEITSRHELTSAFLREWQEHRLNRLQTRSFEWCDELTRTGNLFLILTTDQAGMTYLRAVPAYDVDEIETKANDVEQPTRFVMKPTLDGREPIVYTAYDEETDAQTDAGDFPAVMLHYAINRPVGAKWGESDLAPLLTWLTRYASWLQDRARLNKYRQAFMYTVTGNFTSAAERQARQAELNANPPQPGSILVTDTSEIWTVLAPKLDSSDANTDGLALKKMIAAGAGVPLHFLAEPESSTRTTAEAAGGPTYRHYQQRQVFFLWILRDLARIVIRRRAMVDRHISVKAEIVAQAPDISGKDNAALAVATTQIVNAFVQLHTRGLIPDDELIRMAYYFAGETVDVDEILARAPRKPLYGFGQPAPVTTPDNATPGQPGGTGGPPGQANQAKPYNQNPETGDVSAKGAQMAEVPPEIADQLAQIRAMLANVTNVGASHDSPAPPPPAPPAPITNTVNLDLSPVATAIADSQRATADAIAQAQHSTAELTAGALTAVSAALDKSGQAAAQAITDSAALAADLNTAGLQSIGRVLEQLANQPAPPAPIIEVQAQAPAVTVNVPAQPAPVVNVTVENPKRTKIVHRDDDDKITAITEE